MLKKVTTQITYRVPAGHHCNLNLHGSLTKKSAELCRFCVKDKHGYRCALYNMPLTVEQTVLPLRTEDCVKASLGFNSVVQDVPDNSLPEVDPKLIIKTTITEYNKLRKKFISQGYPEAIADKVAQEALLGGK